MINNEYNDIVNRREKLAEKKEILENEENIQKYIMLRKVDRRLLKEEHAMYEKMQTEIYNDCEHLLIYTKITESVRGRDCKKCACVKCGLDETILDKSINSLNFEEKVQYNYLKKHNSYINGVDLHTECDLALGMAIYNKLKENHPNLENSKAVGYFKYAINHIKFVEVSDRRKVNRAKRLSLSLDFDKWKSINDIWKKK